MVLLNVDMTWGYVATFVMHFFLNCSFDTKSCVQMVQISLS